ncbi:MAG: alkaline phosphatase [Planctomycetaceae bacterium]|nr:alkaline phosphatase [Planctomycetaceae bacterium]
MRFIIRYFSGQFHQADRHRTFLLIAVAAMILFLSIPVRAENAAPPKKAKNVILMIGDGMGFNQTIAGAYWRYGKLGEMACDQFPVHCGVTTFSSKGGPVPRHYEGYNPQTFWQNPKSAAASTELTTTTDSAAAITSLQTGEKTRTPYLGVGVDKKPLLLVSEVAKAAGKSTGAVSTMMGCHATPAGVGAHNAMRDDYSNIFLELTGENGLTVLVGAGHPCYNDKGVQLSEDKYDFKAVGGEATWEEIKSTEGRNGYTLIEDVRNFEKLARDKKNLPKKLLGIAKAGFSIPPVDGAPSTCPAENGVIEKMMEGVGTRNLPTLTTMSLAAINVLSQNENGFYLMIEGGAIDTACHENNQERFLMEQTGFTKAVDAIVQWVENNSSWDETVLLVTADHETGFLWGAGTFLNQDGKPGYNADQDEFVAFRPIVNEGCGRVPGMQFISSGHSNSLVPLWGIGPGIEELEKCCYGIDEKAAKMWNFSGKYLDNADIGMFLKSKM